MEMSPTQIYEKTIPFLQKRFFDVKRATVKDAARFYYNNRAKQIIDESIARLEDTAPEYPQVYQIVPDTFSDIFIPTITKDDDAFKKNLEQLFPTYFPDFEIEEKKVDDANSFVLHFDTKPARRFAYFRNLLENHQEWHGFLFEKFKAEVDAVDQFKRELFRFDSDSNLRLPSVTTEMVTFEENPALDYSKISIAVPFDVYYYLVSSHAIDPSYSYDDDYHIERSFFEVLTSLVTMSLSMHFISDRYATITQAIAAEVENQAEIYRQEQQAACVAFDSEMELRTIPVSSLSHKTGKAFAEKQGFEEIFYPFSNKEAATKTAGTKFVLYNKENAKDNTDWIIVPPSSEIVELPGYTYHGVHTYMEFNKDTWLAQKGEAPHVISERNYFNTAIDEAIFMDMLLKQYPEDTRYGKAIRATNVLLEKYPKLLQQFSLDGLESVPELQAEETAELFPSQEERPRVSGVNLLRDEAFTGGNKLITANSYVCLKDIRGGEEFDASDFGFVKEIRISYDRDETQCSLLLAPLGYENNSLSDFSYNLTQDSRAYLVDSEQLSYLTTYGSFQKTLNYAQNYELVMPDITLNQDFDGESDSSGFFGEYDSDDDDDDDYGGPGDYDEGAPFSDIFDMFIGATDSERPQAPQPVVAPQPELVEQSPSEPRIYSHRLLYRPDANSLAFCKDWQEGSSNENVLEERILGLSSEHLMDFPGELAYEVRNVAQDMMSVYLDNTTEEELRAIGIPSQRPFVLPIYNQNTGRVVATILI